MHAHVKKTSRMKTQETQYLQHFNAFRGRGRDVSCLTPPPHGSVRAPLCIRLVWGFLCQGASCDFGRPLHSILLFDPRREHSSVPTAYFHRRRAQRRSRTFFSAAKGLSLTDASGWLAA